MSTTQKETMKATVWEGKPFHVSVQEKPVPKIQHPNDVIIQITTSAICGSDLHTYRGRLGSKNPPWLMGHEAVGTIVEAGDGLKSLKIGDRVLIEIISCGYCDNCLRGRMTYCLTYSPRTVIDIEGYGPDFGAHLEGAQAEYIRIPFADSSCFKLPQSTEHDLDFILLADIFPTGWYALDCANFQPGDTVAVFGAGPVGLLCAYSALLRGASKVYSVDYVPARLEKAASIGAIPIDFTKEDPVTQIMAREPRGVRCSCDCVGLDCLNDKLEPQENIVLNNCIRVTEPTGGIGLIGIYVQLSPSPGVPLASPQQGVLSSLIGQLWAKGLSVKSGTVEIHRLQPSLRDMIESGKAKPSFVIDEILHSVDEVPRAYERFEKREIIKPVIQLPHPKKTSD
ncbi:glutathione-independent formaldehyde dehydrogenase [Aspergillus ibericus CBS 121593]|uniref:Theronine dehydrogenase n=1 Tax=Aspergillus ibericus CBS 121593 TaxID=1448316 RepID=A0A395H6I1_9EURO|nr:theronine dehydrogenase [Aspergillus ibericus CBS 121593]RAL03517.1 theronine dehydrogenase [Aspergillus ibericus CBS 121593]